MTEALQPAPVPHQQPATLPGPPPAELAMRTLANAYRMLEAKVATLTRDLDEMAARKEAELEQKNQLAKRLQTLLEFLPGGVIVLDEKGLVVQSNPAARTMLEHTLEGHRWRDLISSCFAPRSDDGLEISTVSGHRISLATASLQEEGQIILLTDQTETRHLQQQVGQFQKLSALGKMVSALAHQIRTPLSAAILYANHLHKDALEPAQRGEFAAKLLGRLKHMEHQVRDMLLFVRNELPLNDVISVNNLEEGLRAAMEVPLANNNANCDWRVAKPDLRIRCNREALISAILNLANNALEASAAGRVRMKLSLVPCRLNSKPLLAVALLDYGKGMSAEKLKRTQEMFYTNKPQGTGLGLAVVRSVARAHGGHFELRSSPGRGTCALLFLPIEQF